MSLVTYATIAENTRIVSNFPSVESAQTKGLSRNVISGWMQPALCKTRTPVGRAFDTTKLPVIFYDLSFYRIP
jgi:hypothetical protein